MESLDKTIECLYQSLLAIEESKDHMMESLGLAVADIPGAATPPGSSKLDGRIDRLTGINERMQNVQVGMVAIQGELDKI